MIKEILTGLWFIFIGVCEAAWNILFYFLSHKNSFIKWTARIIFIVTVGAAVWWLYTVPRWHKTV